MTAKVKDFNPNFLTVFQFRLLRRQWLHNGDNTPQYFGWNTSEGNSETAEICKFSSCCKGSKGFNKYMSEIYKGVSQIPLRELFWRNCQQRLAVKYFRKKLDHRYKKESPEAQTLDNITLRKLGKRKMYDFFF